MLTNVTIDGNKQQINIIDLHARANTSGDAQGKYDMRKFDVEVLKDTLDAQYPNANLILLEIIMTMLITPYQMCRRLFLLRSLC
jgi:hypothetical protein